MLESVRQKSRPVNRRIHQTLVPKSLVPHSWEFLIVNLLEIFMMKEQIKQKMR